MSTTNLQQALLNIMKNTFNEADEEGLVSKVGGFASGKAIKKSNFESFQEVLASQSAFEKQCDFIFSSNENYAFIASEVKDLTYKQPDGFIRSALRGIDTDKVASLLKRIGDTFLTNEIVVRNIIEGIADDVIPVEKRSKIRMAAQHVADKITDTKIAMQGPKKTQTQTQSEKPTVGSKKPLSDYVNKQSANQIKSTQELKQNVGEIK